MCSRLLQDFSRIPSLIFFFFLAQPGYGAEPPSENIVGDSFGPAHQHYRPIKRIYGLTLPSPFNDIEVTIIEDANLQVEALVVTNGIETAQLPSSMLEGISQVDELEFSRVATTVEEPYELDALIIMAEFGESELIRQQRAPSRRERNMLEITVSKDFEVTLKIYDWIGEAKKAASAQP